MNMGWHTYLYDEKFFYIDIFLSRIKVLPIQGSLDYSFICPKIPQMNKL